MTEDDGAGLFRRRRVLALCAATGLAGCTAPSDDSGGSPATAATDDPETSAGGSDDPTTAGTTATETTDPGETTETGTTDPGTTTGEDPSVSVPPDLSWSMHAGDATNTGVLDTTGPSDRPGRVWDVPVEGIYTLPGPAYADGVSYVGSGRKVYAVDVEEGRQPWTAEVDYLTHHYSPAVADGRVFVAARTLAGIQSGGGDGALYALDAASGTVDWRVDVPVSSPPTVADGTVYVTSSTDVGTVHAFDTAGGERWSFEFAPDDARGSAFGAPAVLDGTVYATVSGHAGDDDVRGYLYALEEGNVRWRYGVEAECRVDPVVGDGTAYVATGDGTVHAVTLDGDQRWSTGRPGTVYTTPAVGGDHVYVLAKGTVVALSRSDGEAAWESATGDQLFNGLAVTDRHVYLGGGNVIALDRADGSTAWTYPIPGFSGGYGAPIAVGGAVVVGACIKWDQGDPYDDHLFALV